jgi:hypothetical protein
MLGLVSFLARAGSAQTIQASGPLDSLLMDLRSGNEDREERALSEIAKLGPSAKDAAPAILDYMCAWEGWVDTRPYEGGVSTLTSIGPGAIPVLIDALGDEDDPVADATATVLGNLGRSSVEALKAVLRKDDPSGLRHGMAAWAGGRMEPTIAESATDALIAALRESRQRNKPGDRAAFVEALGHLSAPRVVPEVVACLGDADEYVRRTAIQALGGLDASSPAMNEALDKSGALQRLTEISEKDADQVPRRLARAASASLRQKMPRSGPSH